MQQLNNYRALTGMLLAWLLSACSQPEKADEQVLITADIAFSEMAATDGVGKAFIHYADSNAMIVHERQHPMSGLTEITKAYSSFPASTSLSWRPLHAEIAASGDLGYTFGEYELTANDSTARKEYGYYITVWKRQPDGSWKYVFDTGSEKPLN
ncbi:Ketosteroid isomerase-like protein [Fulvivirga imtechensis AK7]|uniref:Ketosteroid isomerase-like protein n=1 Tax=Fulvivirga imtechensis AK7 TaxID=1237149 RepID=L8K0R4_9BACT|nr:DUF4440 domain-containing protein [Fulvivirga imtechensis]ELR73062.1 Ketosteroid isomerase-like protein [Fulvivirga imtechensis AK7]